MRARGLVVVIVSALGVVGLPVMVSAHTEFDYSEPAEGDSVDEPVGEIVVAFTDTVDPVGNGFEVLDPQGSVLVPEWVTDDGAVFRLLLDPPLAGGDVGVRYEVMAEDGHVQEGSFSFTVAAAAPTTSTMPSTTTAAPDTAAPEPTPVETTLPETTLLETTVPAVSLETTVPDTTTTAEPAGGGGFDAGGWLFGVIAAALILAALSWLMARRRPSTPEPE